MLWQSSSQKQPHVLQTSQEHQGALMPEKVFNPEDRYKIWRQDWASVSKTSRFLRTLSHPGLASRDGWRHPAWAALGVTGEELQLLCLAQDASSGLYLVSASARHPLPPAKWIRDSGIPRHTPTCIATQETQVPVCIAFPSFPWCGIKHSRDWKV